MDSPAFRREIRLDYSSHILKTNAMVGSVSISNEEVKEDD
jgi:hypothetical protein